MNRAANFLIPMTLMPVLGMWYLAAMPADSRSWVLGGSPAMTLFLSTAVAASLAIGAYAIFGLVMQKLYINLATATLLVALALGATAGGEFVREGSRKPYSIRHVLYSNAILPEEVAQLRRAGCVANDPYPLRDGASLPGDQVRLGARVFRRLCSVCHTIDGTNGLAHLTASWDFEQMRLNIAKLQQTKPFMPPFAGTPEELEALVQYLAWSNRGRPSDWESSLDPQTLSQIASWLDEAGTQPRVAD
jgi:mono/diheme cytochrome c family protein